MRATAMNAPWSDGQVRVRYPLEPLYTLATMKLAPAPVLCSVFFCNVINVIYPWSGSKTLRRWDSKLFRLILLCLAVVIAVKSMILYVPVKGSYMDYR